MILWIFNIIVVISILCILYFNRTSFIEKTINRVSQETQFSPTYFEIYDKSTPESCDRLIIVYPFQWYILASNDNVYIVGDTNYTEGCSANSIDAIRITTEKDFIYCCLNFTLIEMLNLYQNNITPVRINYNMEELQSKKNAFTILDALNFLFTKYITITHTSNNIIKHRYKYDKFHLFIDDLESIYQPGQKYTRKLTKREIIQETDKYQYEIPKDIKEKLFYILNRWQPTYLDKPRQEDDNNNNKTEPIITNLINLTNTTSLLN